jgi:hypothetical protein
VTKVAAADFFSILPLAAQQVAIHSCSSMTCS